MMQVIFCNSESFQICHMKPLELIRKYNVPGPRYTSYPTVPFWKVPDMQLADWESEVKQASSRLENGSLGVYVHLPFCESLCTFCGCHKRITKNHAVETPYIDSVIAEWALYQKLLPENIQITEIHFGGGTPTFFSATELVRLTTALCNANQDQRDQLDLSFEAHPGSTSEAHLRALYQAGFRRVSFGIQDYDPKVQEAIHRKQSFELVASVHKRAKEIGYTSINHDLVYGLPFQDLKAFEHTIARTIELMPERIALYGYAHVPWIKGTGQRGYDESNLPKDEVKRALYEMGYERLLAAGYIAIGMDHFALPGDSLEIAFQQKQLHRNFMGYTHRQTDLMIGLGMSAISDSWSGFAQNDKSVEAYQERIAQNELAVFRGHFLSEEELLIRRHILDLMCHFETNWQHQSLLDPIYPEIRKRLQPLLTDGLIELDENGLRILPQGYAFVRNVCMTFDLDLHGHTFDKPLFSATI
ncbi:MAG: oxygen-independent coproporphyrinogen oxidase [Bacteroidota bacterium]|jgi:oxygen-independent coproporphyrinogen-3 oxidase